MAKPKTIKLPITPENTEAVAAAIAFVHGYQETVPDGEGGVKSNPQSKIEFANDLLRRVVRSWVESHRAEQSQDQARKHAAQIADDLGL